MLLKGSLDNLGDQPALKTVSVNIYTHPPLTQVLSLRNLDGEVAQNKMVRKDWKDRGEGARSVPQLFLGRVWNFPGEKM